MGDESANLAKGPNADQVRAKHAACQQANGREYGLQIVQRLIVH